ncbi:MAG: hypothetical protein OJF51_003812 [Nitrospira sp.]|jgi:hypothetical protein|nr:MAG: hypothetical protein OJF51_003812 [Nitrospira sp.]
MASAFSHTFVAPALGKAFQHPIMAWPVLLSGSVYSIVPDLDVIGFTSASNTETSGVIAA